MKNQRWYRKGRNTIKAAGLGTMLLLLAFAGQAMADSAEDIKAAEETETVEETGRTEEEETEALEETELSEETDPQTAKPAGNETEEKTDEKIRKNETVYVIADAAGTPENVIVSDWLKNPGGEEFLTDRTALSDIENTRGDETYSESDDGTITWDAQGEDIFYQGTTDQELPVTMTATYYLDGTEMTPEEIAGKSGEVKIRISYENHETTDVDIDGTKYPFHVPFAALTGMLLDDSSLTDIEIENGRIISDGDHMFAVGIAFPGIAEDLQTEAYASLTGLMKEDVPDYMEITAKTDDFHMNTFYTVVTNEIFGKEDLDIGSMLDDVFGKLSSLESGVGQISDGVSALQSGAKELKSGAGELSDGLAQLTDNNESLRDGALQVFNSLIGAVSEEVTKAGIPVPEMTTENYDTVLDGLILLAPEEAAQQLKEAKEQLDSYQTFYDGLLAYTDGVASAKDGADQLSKGAASLSAGASKLYLGTTILSAALPDLSGVSEAVKGTAAIAGDYQSFSGLGDDMEGKVRFIWKVAGI